MIQLVLQQARGHLRYGQHMTGPLAPDALYESARWFAHTALQDHHDRKFQRAAIAAGVALEHLAKALIGEMGR